MLYRILATRETLPPLQEPVVTFCNSGSRSSVAASLLERFGLCVVDVEGGTMARADAGFSLVRQKVAL